MTKVLFYLFSSLAIVSATAVILHPRPTRALLSLIVSMVSLAVLFLLLGAPFVAMAHMIVYAGAVLVLFLFVIMLTGIAAKETPLLERFKASYLFLACFAAVAFFVVMMTLLAAQSLPPGVPFQATARTLSLTLFRDYLLPFELISLLLLLGVFAAIALAKKDPQETA